MKKVLSFVLVLALVLGSFSMAFAAPAVQLSDIAGDANEEAINVVNGLGIVTGYPDGTFAPDKDVTRAEFAAMITRALAIPASALAGYTATAFNDVEGYAWAVPYLAFCETKGIMLGDGNGNVMPGRTINVNEAVTMVLRALGLTDNASLLVGSWPANYVTVAKNYGLYTDVDATVNVDRASAAQLIYNALDMAAFGVDAEGRTTTYGDTLIEGLGCVESTVAAVAYTVNSKIVLNDYIGAAATVYTDADGDIVAINPTSTFLTGKFNTTGDAFTVGNTTYTVSVDTIANKFVNNQNMGAVSTSAVTGEVKIAATVNGAYLTAINSVVTWTISDVFVADEDTAADIAEDKAINGNNFLLDENKAIVASSYEILGVDALDKIAEDAVVYVYVGNGVVTKIEVGTKTVAGTVEKTSVVDGTTNYAIAGTNYTIATTTGAGATLVLGAEGTATLDYAGKIYSWEAKTTPLDNYAVVIATDKAVSFGNATYAIKLFTAEGTTITPVCDATQAGLFAADTLVKYALNDKGEVKDITTAAVATVTGALAANDTLIGTQVVAADVIVLLNDTQDGWKLGKMADLADTVTVEAITNSAAKLAIIVANEGEGDFATTSSDDVYGIVTKNDEKVLNADKATVQVLNLLVDGAAKNGLNASSDSVYTGTVSSDAALKVITINSKGVVTGITNATVTSLAAATVTAVEGNIVTLNGSASYQLAENVVVYAWNAKAEAWEVITAAKLKDKTNVTLYDVKTDSKNPGYEIVIAR